MKAIIRWTILMRRWSTMWWSIAVAGFIFINMVFYPTFKDQAAELEKSFADLPEAALQLFGGSADFFSPVGFLNSQIFFLMLPLMLSVLAISLGSSLIAREEQDKTIELLLARSISRGRLLGAKALAGTLILSAVALTAIIITVICGKVFGVDVSTVSILVAGLSCWLLALSTGAIACLLTSTGRARSAALGVAALVGIGGYLIGSLAGTVDWLKVPAKAFPFHYYQSEAILNGTYDWVYLLFPIGIIALCAIGSHLAFRRRDIE